MKLEELIGPAFVGATIVVLSFASRKLTGQSLGIKSSSFSDGVQVIILTTAFGGVMLWFQEKKIVK